MSNSGWRQRKDLLRIGDFSREEIQFILDASKILKPYSNKGNNLNICQGCILKPVFFEPSTRTRDSFIAAMLSMGGSCLPSHSETSSSREKGETKLDTLVTYEQYCDIMVIRDSDSLIMEKFAKISKIPVINGGSGSEEHPTQTLLDLYTILEEIGSLDNLTLLVLGDLKYGRTVHSLIQAIQKFENNKIIGFPVKDLALPEKFRCEGYEEKDITQLLDFSNEINSDGKVVVYATRVQWERIAHERFDDFNSLDSQGKEKLRKDIQENEYRYEVTLNLLSLLPQATTLLHPLPRGPELNDELFFSNHKKVAPIRQTRYGLQVRMGILGLFLGNEAEILELAK